MFVLNSRFILRLKFCSRSAALANFQHGKKSFVTLINQAGTNFQSCTCFFIIIHSCILSQILQLTAKSTPTLRSVFSTRSVSRSFACPTQTGASVPKGTHFISKKVTHTQSGFGSAQPAFSTFPEPVKGITVP